MRFVQLFGVYGGVISMKGFPTKNDLPQVELLLALGVAHQRAKSPEALNDSRQTTSRSDWYRKTAKKTKKTEITLEFGQEGRHH